MLEKLSRAITSFFIDKNILGQNDREVYNYCFEILLSTIMNLICVIAIAILTRSLIPTVLFVIVFMCMRGTAGGYHADSHLACLLTLLITYSIFLLVIKNVSGFSSRWLTASFVVFENVIVFALAPVEDRNKRFEGDELLRFRRRSRRYMVIISIIAVTISYVFPGMIYANSMLSGSGLVALALIAGRVKNRNLTDYIDNI